MADPVDSPSDDALLTAYIDGELAAETRAAVEQRLAGDAGLAARLQVLRQGGGDFAGAYDLLLAGAPHERLSTLLAEAVEQTRPAVPARRGWRPAAIAAAIAIFVLGAAAGYWVPLVTGVVQPAHVAEAPNWRQAVAEYMGFITPETLAVIPDNPAVLADELSAVGQRIALDLKGDRLALPDATLKRASLYAFNGKPLAQLAYLSGADGALAFCIIANGKPDAAVAFEEREGFNIVFWTRNGLGYMLIGKAPRATLEAFAGDLRARVS